MSDQNLLLQDDAFAPASPDTLDHLPSHHCAPARTDVPAPDGPTRLGIMSLIRSQCHRAYASAIDREDIDTKYMVEIDEALKRILAEAEQLRMSVRNARIEVAEVSKDAARYRWLVYAGWFDDEIMRSNGINEGIGDTVDAAIDAAMTKEAA